jgi:hypothetical protein
MPMIMKTRHTKNYENATLLPESQFLTEVPSAMVVKITQSADTFDSRLCHLHIILIERFISTM